MMSRLPAACCLLFKRKRVIRPEIPEGYNAGGDEFGNVKWYFEPFIEHVNDAVVDGEAHGGGEQKFSELGGDFRVFAVKSPDAVKDVIVHHRASEAQTVGEVLVEAQFFTANPGDAEINHDAGCTNDAEF